MAHHGPQAGWRMFAFRASGKKTEAKNMSSIRVLGIDPGLRNAGWGVIEAQGSTIRHIANGTCHPKGADLGQRLASLFEGLNDVIATYQPTDAAVEQTFVNANGAGTLKLGQARGVAMLAPARAGLPIGEYAPNAIKKAVVGVGHAAKDQIAAMVRLQLPGATLDSADAADALAIALCHLAHLQTAARRNIGAIA